MNHLRAATRTHLWSVGRLCTSGCAITLEHSVEKLDGIGTNALAGGD